MIKSLLLGQSLPVRFINKNPIKQLKEDIMKNTQRPVVLIIRDGWGSSDKSRGNAILNANTPVTDLLLEECPNSKLRASGESVGLPEGFVGNSEVGHIAIGSGRLFREPLTRINDSIDSGKFFSNPAFKKAIDNCKKNNSKLHIMGLLSDVGVHGMNSHLYALLKTCILHQFQEVCIHIFTDGHDCQRHTAEKYLEELQQIMKTYGTGKICTVVGRYYSMDRNLRWDRTQKAYECIANARGRKANTAKEAVKTSYYENKTEEFLEPTVIGDYKGVSNGDSVIFYNYRLDRARQLTHAFIDSGFNSFPRKKTNVVFVCMCEYYDRIMNIPDIYVAYEPIRINNCLGEVISNAGLKQLRIAETEKYAHITYFFNGENETEFKNEQRILISSPEVKTYDLSPKMSAKKITDDAIRNLGKFDFIVINYANADEVGHTGNYEAAIEAIEFEDECIGSLLQEIRKIGGVAIITSDHGNAEKMIDDSGNPLGMHTTNDVEFIVYNFDPGFNFEIFDGNLYDIAPTILEIIGIEKPAEMTGINLISGK